MKHVVVNETLLEEARRVIGLHESDAEVVNAGLSELVRVAALKRGIQTLKDNSDIFWPHYLEEIRPNSYAAYEKRRALYEGREPNE